MDPLVTVLTILLVVAIAFIAALVLKSPRQEQPERLPPPELDGMDQDDFRAAFDVDDDTPLWQAVHKLLDAAIVKAVDDVAPAPSAIFTAEARTHAAGELNALRDLQNDLLRWQQEARRAKSLAKSGSD